MWAGQRNRYSNWLRAGRSGDRIPVAARFSAPVQTGPETHPASCTKGTGSFPGVKSGRGVTLTPHPLLVPLVMKEQSYTSTPPMGQTACTEPQCLYKCAPYLYFRLTIIQLGRCIDMSCCVLLFFFCLSFRKGHCFVVLTLNKLIFLCSSIAIFIFMKTNRVKLHVSEPQCSVCRPFVICCSTTFF